MELLQPGHDGAYHAHVLRGLPKLLRKPRERLEEGATGSRGITSAAAVETLGGLGTVNRNYLC